MSRVVVNDEEICHGTFTDHPLSIHFVLEGFALWINDSLTKLEHAQVSMKELQKHTDDTNGHALAAGFKSKNKGRRGGGGRNQGAHGTGGRDGTGDRDGARRLISGGRSDGRQTGHGERNGRGRYQSQYSNPPPPYFQYPLPQQKYVPPQQLPFSTTLTAPAAAIAATTFIAAATATVFSATTGATEVAATETASAARPQRVPIPAIRKMRPIHAYSSLVYRLDACGFQCFNW